MFNSQKINTDPHPWVSWRSAGSPFEMRWSIEDPDQDELTKNVYRPRAEFDNNPNPLLVAYRDVYDGDMAGWGLWLVLASEAMNAQELAEDVHYEHAKKVLGRLARLSGGEA